MKGEIVNKTLSWNTNLAFFVGNEFWPLLSFAGRRQRVEDRAHQIDAGSHEEHELPFLRSLKNSLFFLF